MSIAFHDYDAHMFVKELGKKFIKNGIGFIAQNKEKYFSFDFKNSGKLAGVTNNYSKEVRKNIQLRFIDSFKFLELILDKLPSNLDDDQCKNLIKFYKGDEDFKLMKQKDVYP